ncbi:metal-dependent hydrolase [Peribacillus sp. N1]
MRYKTHIVSSLTLGAGLSILFNYPFHIGYVAGISLGSLLPDIDEPKSFIGRRSFGIAVFVKQKYGHRGITHGMFAWLVVSMVCLIFPSPLTIGISMGYLFHLIGDFFSVRSIPIFTPFNNNRIKLPISYKTGSLTEDILFLIFTLLLLYLVFIFANLHISLIQSTSDLIVSTIRVLVELLKLLTSF